MTKIIVFEGPDYSGKSSATRKLFDQLSADGLRVAVLRSPGGSEIGEKVREIARSGITSQMGQIYAYALALQATADHITNEKHNFDVIILDRWIDSLAIYQNEIQPYFRKADIITTMICDQLDSQVKVDHKFFFTVKSETLFDRKEKAKGSDTPDRFDSFEKEKVERVLACYRLRALSEENQDSENFSLIKTDNLELSEVSKIVYEKVKGILSV